MSPIFGNSHLGLQSLGVRFWHGGRTFSTSAPPRWQWAIWHLAGPKPETLNPKPCNPLLLLLKHPTRVTKIVIAIKVTVGATIRVILIRVTTKFCKGYYKGYSDGCSTARVIYKCIRDFGRGS